MMNGHSRCSYYTQECLGANKNTNTTLAAASGLIDTETAD